MNGRAISELKSLSRSERNRRGLTESREFGFESVRNDNVVHFRSDFGVARVHARASTVNGLLAGVENETGCVAGRASDSMRRHSDDSRGAPNDFQVGVLADNIR